MLQIINTNPETGEVETIKILSGAGDPYKKEVTKILHQELCAFGLDPDDAYSIRQDLDFVRALRAAKTKAIKAIATSALVGALGIIGSFIVEYWKGLQ